jgi:predicted TIM-barrel fold metal-dependent hydrolase
VIRLAARYPNLYSDIGGMLPLGMWIEQYVDQVGADRLVYGTDHYPASPIFRYNYAKALVDHARISEEDRELIFSGNILRLLAS